MSDNGCLIVDTPIMVDCWKRQQIHPESMLYFLSHMHTDHTHGLTTSWRWPIYCSPLTAKMLPHRLGVPKHLLRPLDLDQSHIIKFKHCDDETMTVTLFDANHCPGSVMFLFEGYFGRILHTGDFRYDPATFPDSYLGSDKPLDRLYMDNTFNNPCCIFPSRAECTKDIIDIITKHPHHNVIIGTHTLGKEKLMVDIALELKTRIVVESSRMETLRILECQDVFTENPAESHIRIVSSHSINKHTLYKFNKEAPTIAVVPSGLVLLFGAARHSHNIFRIPYSDHSSYPELRTFVSRVCTRTIIPIVKDRCFGGHSTSDVHNFNNLLEPSPVGSIVIPRCVIEKICPEAGSSGCRKWVSGRNTASHLSQMSKPAGKRIAYLDDGDESVVCDEKLKSKSKKNCAVDAGSNLECGETPQSRLQFMEGRSLPDKQNCKHVNTKQRHACTLSNVSETCSSLRRKRALSPHPATDTEALVRANRNTPTTDPYTRMYQELEREKLHKPGISCFYSNSRKRKHDKQPHNERGKHGDMGSFHLIRRFSNKKQRVLPAPFAANNSKAEITDARVEVSLGKTSAVKTITNYFQTLDNSYTGHLAPMSNCHDETSRPYSSPSTLKCKTYQLKPTQNLQDTPTTKGGTTIQANSSPLPTVNTSPNPLRHIKEASAFAGKRSNRPRLHQIEMDCIGYALSSRYRLVSLTKPNNYKREIYKTFCSNLRVKLIERKDVTQESVNCEGINC